MNFSPLMLSIPSIPEILSVPVNMAGKGLDRISFPLILPEKRVTKFGSGAKIDCPKEYLGKRAYILICKEED